MRNIISLIQLNNYIIFINYYVILYSVIHCILFPCLLSFKDSLFPIVCYISSLQLFLDTLVLLIEDIQKNIENILKWKNLE